MVSLPCKLPLYLNAVPTPLARVGVVRSDCSLCTTVDGSGLKSIWPLRLGPPDLQSNPRYALRDVEVTAYGRNFAKLSHYYAATPRTKLAPRLVISALTTVRCQPSR